MKKKISFVALVSILVAIFVYSMANAKPYKPFTLDGTAEIPDNVILPDYLERLEMDHTIPQELPDGSYLMFSFFRDPDFQYFDPTGNEQLPYAEMLKFQHKADGTASVHLVHFGFINAESEIEIYFDKNPLSGPASDKLEKIDIPREKNIKFKKVPREKQN